MNELIRKTRIGYRWVFSGLLAVVLLWAAWSLPALADDGTNGESRWNTEDDSFERANLDHFKFVCEPQAETVTLAIPNYHKIFSGTLKEGWYFELYSWTNPGIYDSWYVPYAPRIYLGQLFDPNGNKFGNQLYHIIPKEWRCTLYVGTESMIKKIYPRSGEYASDADFTLKEKFRDDKAHQLLFGSNGHDHFRMICSHTGVDILRVYEKPSKHKNIILKTFGSEHMTSKMKAKSSARIDHRRLVWIYGFITKDNTQYAVADVPELNPDNPLPLLIPAAYIANIRRFMLYDKENDIVKIAPIVYIRASGLECYLEKGVAIEWNDDYWHEVANYTGWIRQRQNPSGRAEAYAEFKSALAKLRIRDKDYQALQKSFGNFRTSYSKNVVKIWLSTDEIRR